MNDKKENSPIVDVTVKITGEDGNAFNIMGIVSNALKKAKRNDLVDAFRKEAMSGDYDHLLQTCMKYVSLM